MKFPILAYHNILPMTKIESIYNKTYVLEDLKFEQQMKYLRDEGYTCLDFTDIYKCLDSADRLPAKPVIITFDDGCLDNYQIAFPILKRYNLKATFFICTDSVDRKGYLTWEQIIEMSAAGMGIQSHTHSHPDLSILGDSEIQKELTMSKAILEEKVKTTVDILALPGGRGDNKTVRDIALASGYLFACNSTWGDNNNINRNTFYLRRFVIKFNCRMEQFISFIDLKRTLLLTYKVKKSAVRLAKVLLGDNTYAKLRRMFLGS
jgi:peptidoglycan/xylan/chitin deacetylase (PgdA/CDA1 family)